MALLPNLGSYCPFYLFHYSIIRKLSVLTRLLFTNGSRRTHLIVFIVWMVLLAQFQLSEEHYESCSLFVIYHFKQRVHVG